MRTGSASSRIGRSGALTVKPMAPLLHQRPDALGGPLGQGRQLDPLGAEPDLAVRQPGDVQQVVDQPGHVPDLPLDHVAGELDEGRVVGRLPQDVDRVEHRGQGVAQLVGEHGEELILAAVGVGQLLGLAAELHLELLAIGGVADHLGEALELAPLVAQGGHDGTPPESRAVATDLPLLARHLAAGRRLPDLRLGLARLGILEGREAREGLADDLGGVISEQQVRAVVPAQHAPVRVEQQDRIVLDAIEEELDPLPIDGGRFLARDLVEPWPVFPRSRIALWFRDAPPAMGGRLEAARGRRRAGESSDPRAGPVETPRARSEWRGRSPEEEGTGDASDECFRDYNAI